MTAAVGTRDPQLVRELETLGRVRVFFAHRSVGADLIDGLRAIAAENDVASVNVREVDRVLAPGVFGHAMLTANGDPAGKLHHFERMVCSGIGDVADVVLFKFCYADFSSETDATWLFRSYDRTIRALRSGAAGYMLKDAATAELELAISSVREGKTYLSPSISRTAIDSYLERMGDVVSPLEQLTSRQREILQLIGEGKNTKEIASNLEISVKTVEAHRLQVMERLRIHDVPGLVRFAIRTGLVSAEA